MWDGVLEAGEDGRGNYDSWWPRCVIGVGWALRCLPAVAYLIKGLVPEV